MYTAGEHGVKTNHEQCGTSMWNVVTDGKRRILVYKTTRKYVEQAEEREIDRQSQEAVISY